MGVICAERSYKLAYEKYIAYKQLLSCRSAPSSGTGTQHSGSENSIEQAYCRLADYGTAADELLQEYIDRRTSAENKITQLQNPIHQEIISRRYIIGQKWEDIACSMNYGLRHIHKIHGAALIALCNLYK